MSTKTFASEVDFGVWTIRCEPCAWKDVWVFQVVNKRLWKNRWFRFPNVQFFERQFPCLWKSQWVLSRDQSNAKEYCLTRSDSNAWYDTEDAALAAAVRFGTTGECDDAGDNSQSLRDRIAVEIELQNLSRELL